MNLRLIVILALEPMNTKVLSTQSKDTWVKRLRNSHNLSHQEQIIMRLIIPLIRIFHKELLTIRPTELILVRALQGKLGLATMILREIVNLP